MFSFTLNFEAIRIIRKDLLDEIISRLDLARPTKIERDHFLFVRIIQSEFCLILFAFETILKTFFDLSKLNFHAIVIFVRPIFTINIETT